MLLALSSFKTQRMAAMLLKMVSVEETAEVSMARGVLDYAPLAEGGLHHPFATGKTAATIFPFYSHPYPTAAGHRATMYPPCRNSSLFSVSTHNQVSLCLHF